MIKHLTIFSLLTSAALMADTPTTGDILRQTEPPKVPEAPKTLPSFGEGKYKAPLRAKDDVKIVINSFTFSGNTAFSSDVLLALVKPYEKSELGINGLREVAAIITKYYRDHGYLVAQAYIPEQSLKNGIVEIAIIEGRYGSFEINNTSLVQTDELQNYTDPLKEAGIISVESLERQMLLINTLAGVQITGAEIYPGKEMGTSDLRLTTAPTHRYTGYAVADNYGNRYSGENRLNVGAFINSPSGTGDTLSFTGLISDTANLKNIRFGYDRPIGYRGLRGGLSAGIIDYTLDKITNYEAFGKIYTYNAYLSYPIVNTQTHTRTVSASYDHRDMKNASGIPGSVEEEKKAVDALTLKISESADTSLFALPGRVDVSAGVTGGHLGLKNGVASANDAALNAAGNYAKVNVNMAHSQSVVEKTFLITVLKGQKSFGKNLDSSEKISVGGSNGVRAYEDAELSGDQGYAFSLEMMHSLPPLMNVRHNASVFVDTARVWKNSTRFNTEYNIRNLNAFGLGYSLNYGPFDLKMTFAHGFGSDSVPVSEAEFSTSKNKFLIQGIARF